VRILGSLDELVCDVSILDLAIRDVWLFLKRIAIRSYQFPSSRETLQGVYISAHSHHKLDLPDGPGSAKAMIAKSNQRPGTSGPQSGSAPPF
jgi:hypothetical protein